MSTRYFAPLITGLLCFGLGSCFFGEPDDPSWVDFSAPSPTYSIGGTVAGVAGVLTLQNSNGTLLNVAANGAFAFETPMVSSALYNVTVAVPPAAQACTVTNGSGTVGDASIRTVRITCR